MKKIKKCSIGYNTILSTKGVIFTKGVKSKPNSIEVFGFTHEVGEGEKSPDNPYTLQSLDSGSVNLYNPDSISEIVVTNEGAIRKGIELDASKFRSGYISIFHTSSIDISDNTWSQKGINIKFFRNGKYDKWTDWCLVLNSRTEQIPEDVSKILLYETNASNAGFAIYQNLTILDSPILPTEPVTDEHSVILSNNDMSIKVPVPIALNSVEGVSDYIFKDSDGVWKLMQNNKKNIYTGTEAFTFQSINDFGIANFVHYFNDSIYENKYLICSCFQKQNTYIANTKTEGYLISQTTSESGIRYKILYFRIKSERASTLEEFKTFLAEQYENGNPLTIVYQLETPIVHVLSDYAQQLLNSFTLQNTNRISVEGNPDIRVSGYIQK